MEIFNYTALLGRFFKKQSFILRFNVLSFGSFEKRTLIRVRRIGVRSSHSKFRQPRALSSTIWCQSCLVGASGLVRCVLVLKKSNICHVWGLISTQDTQSKRILPRRQLRTGPRRNALAGVHKNHAHRVRRAHEPKATSSSFSVNELGPMGPTAHQPSPQTRKVHRDNFAIPGLVNKDRGHRR